MLQNNAENVVNKVTNEETCRRIGRRSCLWNILIQRRNDLIGHALLEGCVEIKNYRCRPRVTCINQMLLQLPWLKTIHYGDHCVDTDTIDKS